MKVFILLAVIGAAMAGPRGSNRIVGGEETTIEQYPFLANMQKNWWGIIWSHSCGGSLITPVSVLSATHCYHGDTPSSWRVRLGSSFSSSGGSLHSVSQLIFHPGFTWTSLDFDVAVVRLATPAIYSSSIAPARIPSPASQIPDGRVAHAIGWGALWYGGPTSEQLQHVDVNVINQGLCVERYAYLKTQPGFEQWPDITPTMLCTGILDVGGKDACQGDSGGPIAIEGNIVIGITSWGYRCADPFYPGVNARVTSFTNWIAANA